MDVEVKLEGLSELEDSLSTFAPKLVKRAFRRAAVVATAPQIAAAKAKAPVMAKGTKRRRPGELRDAIVCTVKLTKRGVRARVGPKRGKGETNQSPGTWGLMEEFGSVHNPPQPYLRPAFDQTRQQSLELFAGELSAELAQMGKSTS